MMGRTVAAALVVAFPGVEVVLNVRGSRLPSKRACRLWPLRAGARNAVRLLAARPLRRLAWPSAPARLRRRDAAAHLAAGAGRRRCCRSRPRCWPPRSRRGHVVALRPPDFDRRRFGGRGFFGGGGFFGGRGLGGFGRFAFRRRDGLALDGRRGFLQGFLRLLPPPVLRRARRFGRRGFGSVATSASAGASAASVATSASAGASVASPSAVSAPSAAGVASCSVSCPA